MLSNNLKSGVATSFKGESDTNCHNNVVSGNYYKSVKNPQVRKNSPQSDKDKSFIKINSEAETIRLNSAEKEYFSEDNASVGNNKFTFGYKSSPRKTETKMKNFPEVSNYTDKPKEENLLRKKDLNISEKSKKSIPNFYSQQKANDIYLQKNNNKKKTPTGKENRNILSRKYNKLPKSNNRKLTNIDSYNRKKKLLWNENKQNESKNPNINPVQLEIEPKASSNIECLPEINDIDNHNRRPIEGFNNKILKGFKDFCLIDESFTETTIKSHIRKNEQYFGKIKNIIENCDFNKDSYIYLYKKYSNINERNDLIHLLIFYTHFTFLYKWALNTDKNEGHRNPQLPENTLTFTKNIDTDLYYHDIIHPFSTQLSEITKTFNYKSNDNLNNPEENKIPFENSLGMNTLLFNNEDNLKSIDSYKQDNNELTGCGNLLMPLKMNCKMIQNHEPGCHNEEKKDLFEVLQKKRKHPIVEDDMNIEECKKTHELCLLEKNNPTHSIYRCNSSINKLIIQNSKAQKLKIMVRALKHNYTIELLNEFCDLIPEESAELLKECIIKSK